MANQSLSLAPGLFLNRLTVYEAPKKKTAPEPTHHIIVIDCSGSMSGELPRIRTQLKNKLASLVQEKDTVSIVWFSSNGQCGSVVEKMLVKDPTALERLNTAIDRWLKPVGCTGFVDPLKKVQELATRGSVHSLIFLTDGMDNCWSVAEILKATRALSGALASACFVEYGWYCNRKLLADMAEEVGGSLVTCENFDAYEPVFNKVLSRGEFSAKWVTLEVPADLVDGIVFATGDNGPVVYKAEAGKVSVPEKTDSVYFYTSAAVGKGSNPFVKTANSWVEPIRQSVVALSQRMKSDTVYKVLGGLGDVGLFRKYANAFGKQAQADFQKLALDVTASYQEGRSDDLKVDEDAFTALDLLSTLMEDDGNLLMIGHPDYSYNRIGRATEDAPSFTAEERAKVAASAATATSMSDLKDIIDMLDSPSTLKFVPDTTQGVAISSLTWNESRPNVSALFNIKGHVSVPKDSPLGAGNLPTSVFRNHTFVRDGIINIDKLPVKLTRKTAFTLKGAGVLGKSYKEGEVVTLDLRALPVINRRMAKSVSAAELFTLQYGLVHLEAAQKAYKHYASSVAGGSSSGLIGLAAQYGPEAAAWLEERGLTDKGFNPKTVKSPAVDSYMGVELDVKIAGLGSVPSVNDILKKLSAKKALTPREQLLGTFVQECEARKADLDFPDWVVGKRDEAVSARRKAIRRIAEIKFAVVVGQVWFPEFATRENCSMTLTLGGAPVLCSVELKDVKIDI